MNNYLNEAFKQLRLLEQDFDMTTVDTGKVDELKAFVADDVDIPEEEEIIDVEAESEKDLEDDYIGRIIVKCNCCNALYYKKPEDVIVVDGECNLDDVCHVCHQDAGYTIIGKIEPYVETEIKVDVEPKFEEGSRPVANMKLITEGRLLANTKYIGDTLEEATNSERALAWLKAREGELTEGRVLANRKPITEGRVLANRKSIGDVLEEATNSERAIVWAKEHGLLEEGIQNAKVETDTEIINIATEEKPYAGKETIAPLTTDEIEAYEEPEEEEVPIEDVTADDMEEIDTDLTDEMVESFLKENYNNVDEYETTEINQDGDDIILEGRVKFKSGKEKKTKIACTESVKKNGRVEFRLISEQLFPNTGVKLRGILKEGIYKPTGIRKIRG